MADGEDEDDVDVGSNGQSGTEGGGASGQDGGGRDQPPEIPAEQSDDAADDGEPQPSTGGEPATQSRGGARFQRLNDEVKTLRSDLERERAERAAERRAQWNNQAAATEQQERERLALMTPDEKIAYENQKFQREMRQRSEQDRMQMHIAMDKTAYEAKATVHPVYARYRDEVERRFNEQLAKGAPVEREVIFKFLLGEKALEGALNSKKQTQAGKKRVEAQRVEPSNNKGDTATQRGKAGSSAEERLKGMFI